MIQSVSSSLAAQEEKREKNPPTLPKIAKMWTIFFGAAILPSPSSVKDKLGSFAKKGRFYKPALERRGLHLTGR